MGFFSWLNASISEMKNQLANELEVTPSGINNAQRDLAEMRSIKDEQLALQSYFKREIDRLLEAEDYDGISALIEETQRKSQDLRNRASRFTM